jgi:hypothetical protein
MKPPKGEDSWADEDAATIRKTDPAGWTLDAEAPQFSREDSGQLLGREF